MNAPPASRWRTIAGVHPADPRVAARLGRRLAHLPGRWRWSIERLLRWWFAELAGVVPRGFLMDRQALTTLHVPEDDLLEVATTLPVEAIGLASERAAVLIADRTPFAPDAVVAGYRLDPDGQSIRLTVRIVPLARLEPVDPVHLDALVLEGGADMTLGLGIAPSPARRAERRRRRIVAGAIGVAAAIALLSPVVVRQRTLEAEQARLEESRSLLQPELSRAAAARTVRDAAGDARRLQAHAGSALTVLDRLSRIIDDDSYLTRLRMDGRDVTVGGVSGSASALPALIEADGLFEKVRFSAPVSRAPDGRQRFEIGLKVVRR